MQWQVGNISSTCMGREQGLAIVDLENGGGPFYCPSALIFALQSHKRETLDASKLDAHTNSFMHIIALLLARRAQEYTTSLRLGIVVTHSAMYTALRPFYRSPPLWRTTPRKTGGRGGEGYHG